MGKLRIGIVGSGFGSYGLVPAFRRDPRCEVIAIATTSQETAAWTASRLGISHYFGHWDELVNCSEVDAVAIATPPVCQPAIALASMSIGKPVFAEKPLAANLADAEMLVKVAEAYRVPNVMDFLFPEFSVFAKAKELMLSGHIGTPLHIKADWIFLSADHRNNTTTWRTDANAGGGALAHFGSHMIYYLQWFFGPIVSVVGRVTRPSGYPHSGDTLAKLTLHFDDGASGTLTVNSGSPTESRHTVEILGSAGSLLLSNTSASPCGFTLKHYQGGTESELSVEPEEVGIDCRVKATAQIVTRFIDWILTGQPTSPSCRDGLNVQRIIAATIQ